MIDGVVGGGAAAVALGALTDASLGLAALLGIMVALISVIGWIRYSLRLLGAAARVAQPRFPTARE